MVIWGMMTWWYGAGWHQCLRRVKDRIESTLDYFSIGLLFTTLFAPFRQISAGNVRGSLDVQVRAFFDRLISRFIGMLVRLTMIIVGGVVILFNALIGIVFIISWLLVPFLPVLGVILFIMGWMPWTS